MKHEDAFIPVSVTPIRGVHQSAFGPSPAGELTLNPPSPGLVAVGEVIGVASVALSAYHGYKRNDSVGWGVVWGLMGGLFPIITPAIALAQGFGKPATKSSD